jgi:hypothetical protein
LTLAGVVFPAQGRSHSWRLRPTLRRAVAVSGRIGACPPNDPSPWEDFGVAAAGSSLAGLVGRGVDQTSTGSCDQAYALPASQRPTASRTWRAGYAPAMAGTPTRCGYCGRQTITSAQALPGLRPGQAAVGDDGAAAPGSVWRLIGEQIAAAAVTGLLIVAALLIDSQVLLFPAILAALRHGRTHRRRERDHPTRRVSPRARSPRRRRRRAPRRPSAAARRARRAPPPRARSR